MRGLRSEDREGRHRKVLGHRGSCMAAQKVVSIARCSRLKALCGQLNIVEGIERCRRRWTLFAGEMIVNAAR
jgi:hypothetical protein